MSRYDTRLAATSHRTSPTKAEKESLEDAAVSILGVKKPRSDWGEVIGFGVHAVAVIRPRVPTRFDTDWGHGGVVVKLMRRKSQRFVNFHRAFTTIPGLASPHIQQSVAAGLSPRCHVVLEFRQGISVEELLDDARSGAHSLSRAIGRTILTQLLTEIIAPTWGAGHRFWDFRAANLVWDAERRHLALVDTDFFRPSAEELMGTPGCWTQRDRMEGVALRRLPGVVEVLLGVKRSDVRTALEESGLRGCLHGLGRSERHLRGRSGSLSKGLKIFWASLAQSSGG
ncbi:MAG: hypothetical protein HUU25_07825 [Candidatus Sumerlaeia bacterium]|nr:hypothetical protein [Candidatus Sumerlaeia bacterium]